MKFSDQVRAYCLCFMMVMAALSVLLLSGCSQPREWPHWSTHTQPRLQAKQVNSPTSGQNYVLCAHCVHITPLTMWSHRYHHHQQQRRHT